MFKLIIDPSFTQRDFWSTTSKNTIYHYDPVNKCKYMLHKPLVKHRKILGSLLFYNYRCSHISEQIGTEPLLTLNNKCSTSLAHYQEAQNPIQSLIATAARKRFFLL